jgi:hypothetical protein
MNGKILAPAARRHPTYGVHIVCYVKSVRTAACRAEFGLAMRIPVLRVPDPRFVRVGLSAVTLFVLRAQDDLRGNRKAFA